MGTRSGENSDLRWKHISPDFRSVWVYSPKTKTDRIVPIEPSISKMLQARKERIKPKSDDELVFVSPTGKPIDPKNFNNRAWKSVLEAVGVPYRRAYTTRKTAGNHAIDAGANYLDVAAALGHSPKLNAPRHPSSGAVLPPKLPTHIQTFIGVTNNG